MNDMIRARLRPGLRKLSSSTSAAPSSGEVSDTPASVASQSTGSGEVIETTPIPSISIG